MIEFYIVTNQGIPLFMTTIGSDKATEDISKTTLFSGMVSAINTLFNELKAGDVKYFQTTNNEFFMTMIEPFILVMITGGRGVKNEVDPSLFLEKFGSSFRAFIEKEMRVDRSLEPENVPNFAPFQEQLERMIDRVFREIKIIEEEDEVTKNMFDTLW